MRVLQCLLFLGVCLGLAAPAGADDGQAQRRLASQWARELQQEPLTPAQRKISAPLRWSLARFERSGITRENAVTRNVTALANPLVRIKPDGRIQLYVHLPSFSEVQLNALRTMEVEIEIGNEDLAIVQGWAPFDRIEGIAALPFVTRVTPPSYGRPHAGSKTTEGDAILKADQLRALGVDGSGVKVGIISDGANSWAQSRASGNLPASGVTLFGSCTPRPFNGPNCDPGWICDEGTAIAEIVHDIAPGASLAVGAASTSLEFIDRVSDLVNNFGAHVIVDDLGFLGEPFFEDGTVAQAVAAVKNQVVFVSAAGNGALGHYEAQYRDSFNIFNSHDFGGAAGGFTDTLTNAQVNPGNLFFAFLQWNDRFGQSGNDYDLFITDSLGNVLCNNFCTSNLPQTGTQDPVEVVCYFNNTNSSVNTHLAVDRFSGAARRLELFIFSDVVPEYNDPDGSIIGHPAVPGVLAVGAIDASDPGNDDIEIFSSHGPSRIDFPSAQTRPKPDVTAIDGVSVTGAGGFPSTFFGTSAAAPHVAGVAALLMDGFPKATPAQIRHALTRGAVDLGVSGRDNTFGWGRVDALKANNRLKPMAMPWLELLLLDD